MRLRVDPLHSEVEFKIKHLMISTVNGRFSVFDAVMQSNKKDFSDATVHFVCDVGSINTGVAERDTHLCSADFFDSERFPKIMFASTGMRPASGTNNHVLLGELTIKDVTKPVELCCTFNGSDMDPDGQIKYGFDISGIIKRSDYGLSFQSYGGIGTGMVGEDVKMFMSVQMVKV